MRRSIAAAVLGLASSAFAQHPSQSHIRGRAVDPVGHPLADVEVSVVDPATGDRSEVLATTDLSGMFEIDVHLSESGDLGTSASRILLLSRRGRASIARGLWTSTEGAAGTADFGDLPMLSGVSLRGAVHDHRGAPVGGAVVIATDALRLLLAEWPLFEPFGFFFPSPAPFCMTTSDSEGRFELQGARAFGSRIRVRKPGHRESSIAPVGMGDRLEVTLTPTGFARGIAVGPDGEPVATELVLIDEVGHEVSGRSSSDGRFEFTLPSLRRYSVEAGTPGNSEDHRRAITHESWNAAARDDLRVVVPAEPANVNPMVVLDAARGPLEPGDGLSDRRPSTSPGVALHGRLTATNGSIDGFWLLLIEAGERRDPFAMILPGFVSPLADFERSTRVRPDGSYRLDGLSKGDWRLGVRAPTAQPGVPGEMTELGPIEIGGQDIERDYDVSALMPAVISGAVAVEGAEISTSRLAVVAYRVFNAGGELVVMDFGAAAKQWSYVDRSGFYELTMAPGPCELAVLDVTTGVELMRVESVELTPAAREHRELRIRCGTVQVRAPIVGNGASALRRFVRITVPVRRDGALARHLDVPNPTVGLELAAGNEEATIYLPLRDCALALSVWNADPTQPGLVPEESGQPADSTRVLAKAGEVVEVELRVERD